MLCRFQFIKWYSYPAIFDWITRIYDTFPVWALLRRNKISTQNTGFFLESWVIIHVAVKNQLFTLWSQSVFVFVLIFCTLCFMFNYMPWTFPAKKNLMYINTREYVFDKFSLWQVLFNARRQPKLLWQEIVTVIIQCSWGCFSSVISACRACLATLQFNLPCSKWQQASFYKGKTCYVLRSHKQICIFKPTTWTCQGNDSRKNCSFVIV